ncbi:ATP-binding cassette domain-containing protein [Paractinoplanes brasiliensis]|nr:ATP-binding cassette domain-containing protein [Actinoplanes brasiliensis]
MTDQPAVAANGLVKRFGGVTALSGLDLVVLPGQVLGLLGPNGAGKTTAVRILTTLLVPDAGSAHIFGRDVIREPARVRPLLGLSGQYAAVDAYLTGRENLRMIGRLSGLTRRGARRRADELLELLDLTAAADRTARTLSGGTRRRLDVAASLVIQPPVLFLDEPTTGLDPRGRTHLWRLLEEVVANGTAVVLTTQYLEEADRLADQIVVLDSGQVIAAGSPQRLKSQIGGDRLELQAAPDTDPHQLAVAMSGLGAPPSVDRGTARVLVAVNGGPGILPDVARRLAAGGLRVTELALRRPTLDEVFLALTDHPRPSTRAAAGTGTKP